MKNVLFLLPVLVLSSCHQDRQMPGPTATLLSDVNIIDVQNGELLKNRQIIIDSGKIVQIAEKVEHPGDYKNHIDGRGKYALPGLAEMHAHIPSPDTSRERVEETLFLYLSNGITTIRGMLGHPSHLKLREQAANGQLLSPRIFTASPSLNGTSVPTPEEARKKVIQYKQDGYDFLKIHPGILLPVFDTLVKTANEVGIRFAGHVPVAVGIRHALETNYASVDHIDGFLEGLVPESAHVHPEDNGFFGYNFTPLADTGRIKELVGLSKEHKVWIVPTQSLFERWFSPVESDVLLAQPEMKYMPASTLAEWKKRKEETIDPGTGFTREQWVAFDRIRKQLLFALQQDGYGILLGSDAPQLFNVPGFSIHHEMAGMKEAGLTPLQILQAGTIHPAEFFGMEDTFGQIKEGLDADILLVNGNPLQDVSALQNLSGVMVRGRWLSRETIDKELAEIAAHASTN